MFRGLLLTLLFCLLVPIHSRAEAQKSDFVEVDTTTPTPVLPTASEEAVKMEPQPLPDTSSSNFARVVSGGVSLGGYQAGVLYIETEWFKHDPSLATHIFTGASAGSANSLLSAVASCLPANPDPTKDPGYQTWMDLGYRRLFVPEEVGPNHVFSRAPLQDTISRMAEVWKAGLPEKCDVTVGMSVTRLESVPVRIHAALTLPKLTERFAFRIRGRGPQRPPSIQSVVLPKYPFAQPLLPFRSGESKEDTTENLRLLGDVVFASAAFPGAFKPVELDYCLFTPGNPVECKTPTHKAWFIDGGVFDNNPLRLAVQLAEQRFPQGLSISYLDPDLTAFPVPHKETKEEEAVNLMSMLTGVAGEFVATARSRELTSLAESRPKLTERMFITQRNFPTMSELLTAFLGFFESEFRRFDFYIGMLDSYSTLESTIERLGAGAGESLLSTLHPSFASGNLDDIPKSWRPFACVLGYMGKDAEQYRPVCQDKELRDFRILVQVALDRLYAQCSTTKVATSHPHCARAKAGAAVPRVLPNFDDEERTDRLLENETDFVHSMRLLEGYQFHYKDLGLTRDEAKHGRVKLRRAMLSMTSALAAAQPTRSDRILLKSAGRMIANTVQYEPPKNWAYVLVGNGLEIGASFLPFDWNRSWMRFSTALRIDGLRTLLDLNTTSINFTLAAGLEFEILPLTNQFVQPQIGIRGGYRFATRDRFHTRECTEAVALSDRRNCSQGMFQAYAALGIFERIRVQVGLTFFPEVRGFDSRIAQLDFGIGIQLF